MNKKRINFTKKHYDSRNEAILDMHKNGQIGLDEKFKTSCRFCYGCCARKDAVPMSAYDLFRVAKELNMTITDVINDYCSIHIGSSSLLPVIELKHDTTSHKCSLLKNGICKVSNSRPTVCSLFPLGRFMYLDNEENTEIGYIYNGDKGCRKARTYTVREWLETNGLNSDDKEYITWSNLISYLKKTIRKIHKYNIGEDSTNLLYKILVAKMYDDYDTNEDFLPQLTQRIEELKVELEDLLDTTHKAYCECYGHAPEEIEDVNLDN